MYKSVNMLTTFDMSRGIICGASGQFGLYCFVAVVLVVVLFISFQLLRTFLL